MDQEEIENLLDFLEDRASEIVAREASECRVSLSKDDKAQLAKAAVDRLWRRERRAIESAAARAAGAGRYGLDGGLLELFGDYYNSQLTALIRNRLRGRSRPYERTQGEWLARGSMLNVTSYLSMLPHVLQTRRRLLGSEEPLTFENAIAWLKTSDRRSERSGEGSAMRRDGAAFLRAEAIGPIPATNVRGRRRGLEAGDLIYSREVNAPLEAIVLDRPSPKTGRVALSACQPAFVVSFQGEKTAALREAAEQIQTLAGSWLAAMWLILLGVWPGGHVEVLHRARPGRPPLSVEQEYLMYAALETQLLSDVRPFTMRFYAETLERWQELSRRVRRGMTGHPRLAALHSDSFASVESVRKALSRVRNHIEKLTDTTDPMGWTPPEEARERDAVTASLSSLARLGWVRGEPEERSKTGTSTKGPRSRGTFDAKSRRSALA